MLRVIQLCTFLVLVTSYTNAQEKLDSTYTFLSHVSKGSMVAIDEGEIIVIGNGTDTFINPLGVSFARLNLDGTLLVKTYFEDGRHRFFDYLNDICIKDSIAYTMVSGHEPRYILKIQKYTGELLDSIVIPNAFDPNGKLTPVSLHWIDNHRILLCAVIMVNDKAETQLAIYNTDDNSMKYIRNGYAGYDQYVLSALWSNDHIFILGYVSRKGSYVPRSTIVKLDTLGEVEWRFLSPEDSIRRNTRTMVFDKNGDIVYTQNFVKWYFDGNSYSTQDRPGFARIKSDGTLEWEQLAGDGKYYATNDFFDLVEASDNSGFVAVGSQSNFDYSDYLIGLDTLPGGRFLQFDAVISKVSQDGDIQWTRYYSHAESLFSRDIFKSVTIHPDGGYLISGDLVKYKPGQPLVRTWLIHLDEYGCLVPGCDEIVSTVNSNITADLNPLIYPNPALDYLCIYQPENQKVVYTICNMQSKMMDSFSCSIGDMTKIVDIHDYPPGIYVLTKQYESGQIVSVQWVKN